MEGSLEKKTSRTKMCHFHPETRKYLLDDDDNGILSNTKHELDTTETKGKSMMLPKLSIISWYLYLKTRAFHSFYLFIRVVHFLTGYTVKLTRAILPANAGNFARGLLVKRPHTQFTWVTCSLPVKTGKFTRVYAASTSCRIHANCLQPRVNLLEYNGYFTGNFTCGTHENLSATSMQNCLLLQAKCIQLASKNARIAGKNNCKRRQTYPDNRSQKYLQLYTKLTAIAGNLLPYSG